jgi:hypothetical protein
MGTQTKIKQLLRDAKLPERSVPVCLQADLVAEFETAERDLAEAQRNTRDSLAAGTKVRELSERIEALRARMLEHTIDFRLRAMPRPQWRKLLAEHPPRKNTADGSVVDDDILLGINSETFFDALLHASVVEPELDDEDWSLLLDEKLTDAQWGTLTNAAWSLNRKDVDVPFSSAASKTPASSGDE